MAIYGLYQLIYLGDYEWVFRTGLVQIHKANADPLFTILLLYHYRIGRLV